MVLLHSHSDISLPGYMVPLPEHTTLLPDHPV